MPQRLRHFGLEAYYITCVCVDALPIGTNVPVSGTFVQINALLIFVGLLTLGTQTLEGTD